MSASVRVACFLVVMAGLALFHAGTVYGNRGRTCDGAWCWPVDAPGVEFKTNAPAGDYVAYEVKAGRVSERFRATPEDSRRWSAESTAQWEAYENLRRYDRLQWPLAAPTKAALMRYLRTFTNGELAMVGYEGDDGLYHALRQADLRPETLPPYNCGDGE